DDQSLANSREVKTGIQSGQQVQIVSGLKAGEVVVTEGAYGLPDKTKGKVEKAEAPSAAEGAEKDKDKDDEAADTKTANSKAAHPATADDKAKSKDSAAKSKGKKD